MSKRIALPIVCILFLMGGFFILHAWKPVSADGNGTDKIYGCKILSSGLVRLIDAQSSCTAVIEEAVTWRVGPENGTEFPYMCPNCNLSLDHYGEMVTNETFQGRDLTNAQLCQADIEKVSFNDTTLTGADLSHTMLKDAMFEGATLTGTDLSYSMGSGVLFTNSFLTNVNLTYSDFSRGSQQENIADFQGALLSSVDFTGTSLYEVNFTNASLTNVNFTDANLYAAVGLGSKERIGLVWSNTTCPDGTNSEDNAGTCEGHLE
ncbi:pentapeptide repeat-containing protein [Candidatus Uhrbacteria bacterium]|nr:pentapeptide repeat-containing protein [Candidatus Uhrbacteria bacterium]